MSRPNTGPYRAQTTGRAPRGPQPTLYGHKAEMHGHVTAKPDGSSWWLDVPREGWTRAIQERERTSWGPFSGRALSFAPDAFVGWGTHEHTTAPWDTVPAPPKTLRAPQ